MIRHVKLWRHAIVNTRCSWFHGDERGFRSRNHRIHSSGDYKHRPPPDEHQGLRRYHEARAGSPVQFEMYARVVAVREFVLKMRALGHRITACSCGEEHLHALAELPTEHDGAKREVGKCKQKVSHALRDVLPGSIWSEGGEYKRIKDGEHLQNVYDYIRTRQEPGTVVWSHNPSENWIDDQPGTFLFVTDGRSVERAFIGGPAHPGLR